MSRARCSCTLTLSGTINRSTYEKIKDLCEYHMGFGGYEQIPGRAWQLHDVADGNMAELEAENSDETLKTYIDEALLGAHVSWHIAGEDGELSAGTEIWHPDLEYGTVWVDENNTDYTVDFCELRKAHAEGPEAVAALLAKVDLIHRVVQEIDSTELTIIEDVTEEELLKPFRVKVVQTMVWTATYEVNARNAEQAKELGIEKCQEDDTITDDLGEQSFKAEVLS